MLCRAAHDVNVRLDGNIALCKGIFAKNYQRLSGIALKIARDLISEKLFAQERIIKTYFGESSCSPEIAAARRLVGTAKSNEEIRRLEAKGAKIYWSAVPATRLTQAHKSEGRAKLNGGVGKTGCARPVLCRVCGQIRISTSSVCGNCISAQGFNDAVPDE
jgi:hypothetical protein